MNMANAFDLPMEFVNDHIVQGPRDVTVRKRNFTTAIGFLEVDYTKHEHRIQISSTRNYNIGKLRLIMRDADYVDGLYTKGFDLEWKGPNFSVQNTQDNGISTDYDRVDGDLPGVKEANFKLGKLGATLPYTIILTAILQRSILKEWHKWSASRRCFERTQLTRMGLQFLWNIERVNIHDCSHESMNLLPVTARYPFIHRLSIIEQNIEKLKAMTELTALSANPISEMVSNLEVSYINSILWSLFETVTERKELKNGKWGRPVDFDQSILSFSTS